MIKSLQRSLARRLARPRVCAIASVWLCALAIQAAPVPTRTPRPRHVTVQALQPVALQPARPRHRAAKPTAPAALPALYRHRLRMPAPLKGSRDILVHQNHMADEEGLERLEDDADLERLRGTRQLVPLPESAGLHVNPGLPENRRVARAWTARFAAEAGRAFRARFGQPLMVTSAARTVEYQLRLQQVNGNAAAVEGDAASPHLTGQAIDVGKRGMTAAQLAWMRSYLKPLMLAGKIDVEEEFQQACFHISVYRSYLPKIATPPAPRRHPQANQIAQVHLTSSKSGVAQP
jgi:hypothetical protein